MKKLALITILLVFACGQELPIGNWGEPPPDSVLIYPIGENCYYQEPGQCVVSVYKDCEHHCADIILLLAEQIPWTVASFDSGNYERKDDCGSWDFCWEQLDEGIWLTAAGDYAIEIRLSRYFQCPNISGQIDMFGCPLIEGR